MNKQNLLLLSASFALFATATALYATWSVPHQATPELLFDAVTTKTQLFATSAYLGLASISLFFVGAAFPKAGVKAKRRSK